MEYSPPQGWYPDPSRPGRQRWWDGTRWSDKVRRLPGERARAPLPAVLIGIGVALVLTGATLLTLNLTSRPEATAPPSPTSATSNPAGATEPVRTAPPPGPGPVACTVGDPGYRGSHPEDGRLRGGGLVMPAPDRWAAGDPDRMTYAFDAGLVAAPDNSGWAGMGAVRIDDSYSTPEQASATIAACLDDVGEPGTLRVTRSQAATVPGSARAHEVVGVLDEPGRAKEFRVVVADLHSPESLAVYVRVIDPDGSQHAAITTAEAALAAV